MIEPPTVQVEGLNHQKKVANSAEWDTYLLEIIS